jgi:hypothetical protein
MLIDEKIFCNPFRATLLIKGETTKNGVSLSCGVRIYNRNTGQLLNQAISNLEGEYAILGSRAADNYIIAIDPDSEFNLASQDNVK